MQIPDSVLNRLKSRPGDFDYYHIIYHYGMANTGRIVTNKHSVYAIIDKKTQPAISPNLVAERIAQATKRKKTKAIYNLERLPIIDYRDFYQTVHDEPFMGKVASTRLFVATDNHIYQIPIVNKAPRSVHLLIKHFTRAANRLF